MFTAGADDRMVWATMWIALTLTVEVPLSLGNEVEFRGEQSLVMVLWQICTTEGAYCFQLCDWPGPGHCT